MYSILHIVYDQLHDSCINQTRYVINAQGSHSFTDKKNPGLFQDPMKNFPGPFRSPRMFRYKEKMAFTYNIQSVVHCRKFIMKQNVI